MRRVAQKELKRNKMKLRAKIGIGVVVGLCLAYIGCCAAVPKDKIVNGVSMNGVNLSGLTKEAAAEELNKQYQKDYKICMLTVSADENEFVIPMRSSLGFSAEDAAKKAYSVGHGNFIIRAAQTAKSMLLGEEMTYAPTIINEEALNNEITHCGLASMDTTVQTSYELLKDELQITKGVAGHTVDLEALRGEIDKAVEASDYDTVIEAPLLDSPVNPIDMDAIYKKLYAKKKEPTLDRKNGYKVVKAVTGIDFDREEAKKLFDAAGEGEVVHVAIKREEPKISNKEFKKHLFEASIGKCTTYVSGTSDRISNVALAAKTINGTILLPGDEFSYNEYVGERTAARGYKKAPAYSDGQTVQELGGGVCQVSSTLYKAVVLSNLRIIEHHNHTYESSYIGLGMDATVSWDGPDFRFENNTDYPIKIVAAYEDGALTCKIKGAKLNDNYVEFASEVLQVIDYGIKYKDDKTMKAGKEKVLEPGHTGYIVQTYRIIHDGDGNVISSTKEDYNTYSKKDAVVARGVKAAPATTAAPGAATAPATNKPAATTEKKKQ